MGLREQIALKFESQFSYISMWNWHFKTNHCKWRDDGCDGVSNHQPRHCLLNRLFRRRSKKTPKLRVTGLCVGNSSMTGEFPTQMASNTENVSIGWRHHVHENFAQRPIKYHVTSLFMILSSFVCCCCCCYHYHLSSRISSCRGWGKGYIGFTMSVLLITSAFSLRRHVYGFFIFGTNEY